VVTAGAQQGLAAVCSVVCAPGDEILTDGVTYPGIKAVANHLHLTLRAVEGDGEGIRPEALAGVARRGRARLLYCMPTLQNPLGVVASIRRRQALAAVVQQTDLHVIEDDVYGFLASSPPRFCSILPERTFHITSLSKSVAPGLRVGFVVAPPRWIEPITAAVYATTIMAPPSGAEVAAAWIADGTADRIVDWKRSEIAARSKIAARLLTGVHARVVLNCPHVWLPLPGHWSPDTFLRALQRQGILITGAQDFAVTRQVPNAVRLCLGAAPDRRTLAGALGTIRDLMRKRNTVIRTVV
jgi:DNA-binding transcriptional MocR family regulator